MASLDVRLNEGVTFSNTAPFVLIGGVNVIEDRDTLMETASHFVAVAFPVIDGDGSAHDVGA